MVPHGMAPSEVWRWSFSDYREVVEAIKLSTGDAEDDKPPAPDINDFLKFKEEYGERT